MKCPTSGSEGFCVYPFISVYRQPNGKVAPCCVAQFSEEKIDSPHLNDYINSDYMKKYRIEMLQDKLPEGCRVCKGQEESTQNSPRINMNREYAKYIDDAKDMTDNNTGTIDPERFRMRYFDMRTSNICNFKCRSCNQEYSSQWQAENDRTGYDSSQGLRVVDLTPNMPTSVIDEVAEKCQDIETAYFAGGEPLIMDDHYKLLYALAEQNPNVRLRYNTNLSNLNYKNHDLLDLWSKFNNKVEVVASIDHYGPRAEYIRSGTKWNKQLENLHAVANFDNVDLTLSAVVTVFNFLTLDQLIRYLYQEELIVPGGIEDEGLGADGIKIDSILGVYPAQDPAWLSAKALPPDLKAEGIQRVEYVIKQLEEWGFNGDHDTGSQGTQLQHILNFVKSEDTWEQQKLNFWEDNHRLDQVRGENFVETFPELERMMRG